MSDYLGQVKKIFEDVRQLHTKLSDTEYKTVALIAEKMVDCYRHNGKVVFMGNGGSAADAQHIAAELVAKFQKERRGLPAIAFTTDTSIITSIGNDYSFDKIFSRQVEALVNAGDVVVGISTSGNSKNIVAAIEQAKKQGAVTIVFTGGDGGKLKNMADITLCVPHKITARIQEIHIIAGHIICQLIEENLF